MGWLYCWSLLQTTKQSDDACQFDEQLLQPQFGVHRRGLQTSRPDEASFKRVLCDVQQVNPYFRQKQDRVGCPSFSPHQKVTVALRMMAYGSQVDSMDETHGMSESAYLDTLKQLCVTIVQVYKDEYIREPNHEGLDQLIRKAEDCGFLGMIGSLDYMHWDWKNCPTGWQ
ncbi:uncharacterized protein LOC125471488 [Pyrus x bretschneideri]|uniref:uncharacterized protein LOC125471488 n=1 Tax=Pyrus x bretschneideri TaxID=225117 RepID=UPI00202DD89F|nr:uncharacterized protein LOC125471488 [Pyrus x bretschneideri]